MSHEVDLVLDARSEVGESPVWDAERAELVWVDIPRGLIHHLEPASVRIRTVEVEQLVGAVAPRTGGGLVLALQDGFGLLDRDDPAISFLEGVEADDRDTRMNDGACDSAGRFWAGTMAYDMTTPAGALYRLDSDLRVERLLTGVTCSNGIGWSPDGGTMYFVDSGTNGIDAFDFEPGSGSLANRRRLVDVPTELGLPDGLAVDVEGCLWVAIWGGSCVHRYDPGGRLADTVALPTPQVTSCAFGGEQLEELYITTASQGLSAAQSSTHAGGIFRIRPGVAGLPTHSFAG